MGALGERMTVGKAQPPDSPLFPAQSLPAWWERLTRRNQSNLSGLRVGVYGSGGAPYHHAALLALWGCPPVPARAEDIRAGILETLDVLIMPGGGFTAMSGMLTPLGVAGAEAIRAWVGAGGMYLSSCAGSFLPAELGEPYWRAHEEARRLHMVRAPLANGSDSVFEGLTSPGVGAISVSVAEPDHWLARGLPEHFELVHYNGPLFDLNAQLPKMDDTRLNAPEGVIAARAPTGAFTPSEGFMGGPGSGDTLFARCAARGAFTGVTARYGDGQVVLFGSHPEFGFDVLQLGWGPGVTLLANALIHQAERRNARRGSFAEAVDEPACDPAELRDLLSSSAATLSRVSHLFHDLENKAANAGLEPGSAPSFMGRSPEDLWLEASQRAAQAAEKAAALAQRLLREAVDLRLAARWVDEPPLANQDVGFMGLRQLAERAETALEQASRQLNTAPAPLAHAYDGLQNHPFHLAVGSYLSAAGLSAGALLATVTVAALAGRADAAPLEFLLASKGD